MSSVEERAVLGGEECRLPRSRLRRPLLPRGGVDAPQQKRGRPTAVADPAAAARRVIVGRWTAQQLPQEGSAGGGERVYGGVGAAQAHPIHEQEKEFAQSTPTAAFARSRVGPASSRARCAPSSRTPSSHPGCARISS